MSNPQIKNQIDKIQNLLDKAPSVGIVIGQAQDVDTYAAALGLYLTLEAEGKNVQIVSKVSPTVEVSNLFGVNQVENSFKGSTNMLTISVPYKEGEIDKVSYNIEGDKLNVNLFAETNGITFSESDVQYIRKGSAPSLIITIGVQNESEISNLVDLKSVKTIHLDKSVLNTLMGDVTIIDPTFSSLSEIVTQVIIETGLLGDVDAFQNLADGISAGTQNFVSPTTSAFAFESLGFLLQNGAKRKQMTMDNRSDQNTFPREDQFARPQTSSGMVQRPSQPRSSNAPAPRMPSAIPNNFGLNKASSIQNPPPMPSAPRPMNNRPSPQVQDFPQANSFGASNDAIDDNFNQANMSKPSGEAESEMPDEIPDDWFLPKVFKGSRKGN